MTIIYQKYTRRQITCLNHWLLGSPSISFFLQSQAGAFYG